MNANQKIFKGIIEQLPSLKYGDYYGVLISKETLQSYFEVMKKLTGDAYTQLLSNRKVRDGDEYHITIVSPTEWDSVSEFDLALLLGQELSFHLIGMGTASQEEDTTYFVVVESEQTQVLRARVGLASKDLHITLGFNTQDIYNVPKDRTTLVCVN